MRTRTCTGASGELRQQESPATRLRAGFVFDLGLDLVSASEDGE